MAQPRALFFLHVLYCWNDRKVVRGKDMKRELKGTTPYSPKAVDFKLRSKKTQVSMGNFQDSASTFPLHDDF
jgi:hypothetical protein